MAECATALLVVRVCNCDGLAVGCGDCYRLDTLAHSSLYGSFDLVGLGLDLLLDLLDTSINRLLDLLELAAQLIDIVKRVNLMYGSD